MNGLTLDLLFFETRKVIIDLLGVSQPIITEILGAAAGLVTTIMLFFDMIYASNDAKILGPHIGMTAGNGGAVI